MQDRKICAIGVKTALGTTMHGLALNSYPNIESGFGKIVPCGLADAGVTSLSVEGAEVPLDEVAKALVPALEEALKENRQEGN